MLRLDCRPSLRLLCAFVACAACGEKKGGALDAAATDARPDAGAADGAVTPDAPPDAGAADVAPGPDAAADMALPAGLYVSPTLGADSNTGTREAPYRSIEKALSAAKPGEAVLLLPGSYDGTTQPTFAAPNGTLTVPDGVAVRAVEPGTVTLVNGTSAGLQLAGSSSVAGITFRGFVPALRASAGTVQLASLRFEAASANSCVGSPIAAGGTARLTWALGTDDPLGDGIACLMILSDDAQAVLEGGALVSDAGSPFSGVAMLAATGRSKLTIKAMTSTAGTIDAVAATDEAEVVIEGGRFEARPEAAVHIVRGSHTSRVRITGAMIKGGVGGCVTAWGAVPASTPRFELQGVTLADCRVGFWAVNYNTPPAPVAVMDGVTITAKEQGISLGFGGSLTLAASSVTGARTHGLYVFNGSVDASLVMRTTKVMGNMGDGLLIGVRAGNTVDLGTLAEPGGNTLTGNGGGSSVNSNLQLRLEAGALLVTAVGNTWAAGIQGASAQGGYEPAAAQTVLEVTGPQDGANYKILGTAAAGVTLRLAAKP